MCSHCSGLIAAFVRANLANNVATDVYGAARDLHHLLPHMAEAELVAMIDAAVIGTWGAAAIWDRSAPRGHQAIDRPQSAACPRPPRKAPGNPGF